MSKENRSSHAAKRGPMGHRGPGAPTEKAKNFKGTMKQLIAYMRPYYLNIIVSMLFAVLSVVFMVVGPKILGRATTELVSGFTAKIWDRIHQFRPYRRNSVISDCYLSDFHPMQFHSELDDGRCGTEGILQSAQDDGGENRHSAILLF